MAAFRLGLQMRVGIRLAAVLGASLVHSSLALAQPVPGVYHPHVVTNPAWAEKPSLSLLQQFYPFRARSGRVEGHVVVRCSVTAEGATEGCQSIAEAPEGYGFGAAALAVSRSFRFRPKLIDGVPVGGASVTIPVNFSTAGLPRDAFPLPIPPNPVVGPALGVPTIGPEEAIQSAAAAAPRGVLGVFELRVKATGRQDGNVYLNSEGDYRDQRNLTIELRPSALGVLRAAYGADPDDYLIGKQIQVRGTARRIRIDFLAGGTPTGKYYYQTHVVVSDAGQIVVGPGPTTSPPVASQAAVPSPETTPKGDPTLGTRLVGGVASQGRLWLWSATGALVSFQLSDWRREPRFDQGVISASNAASDTAVLRRVSGTSPDGPVRLLVTTFSGTDRKDSPDLTLAEKERPLGLVGAGAAPAVLTTSALYRLERAGWVRLQLQQPAEKVVIRGVPSVATSLDGRSAYVGWNVGEWGGRLQRVDLGSGVTSELFGAGPVTGVVADPEHPACVIASVGLVHFLSSGEVERACGNAAQTIFANKPLADVKPSLEQSEPFFGVARSGAHVWAISPRALYRVDHGDRAETPLPPLTEVGGLRLSRAIPGLIVLSTDLNWGMSLSGRTPLVIAVE